MMVVLVLPVHSKSCVERAVMISLCSFNRLCSLRPPNFCLEAFQNQVPKKLDVCM
jgi:hypothetical protein